MKGRGRKVGRRGVKGEEGREKGGEEGREEGSEGRGGR